MVVQSQFTRFSLILIAGFGLFAAGFAHADTVATFADPTSDGSTPLFTLTPTELAGGWSGTGLRLILTLGDEEYNDVTFTMTDLERSGSELSGGSITFRRSAAEGGDVILRVRFDSATLLGSVGFVAGGSGAESVDFTSSLIDAELSDNVISFGFANPVTNGTTTTYTASFTSSATVGADDGDDDGDDGDGDNGDGDGDDGDGDDGDDGDGNDDGDGDGGTDTPGPEAMGCGAPCGVPPAMALTLLVMGLMKSSGRRRA